MFRRSGAIERIFICVCLLVLVYQLFIGPTIGLANSGDFARIMNWFGLEYRGHDQAATQDLFFNRVFAWNHKLEPHYPSSQLLFLGAALAASAALRSHGLFDIRVLGLVYIICYLLVIALLTRYTRSLRLGSRLLIYGLILFIFMDTGYVVYFDSFYSEPASLLFLAASMGFALMATKPASRPWLPVAGFCVSSVLFAMAKPQNAASALPLAFVAYGLVKLPVSEEGITYKRSLIAFAVALLLSLSFMGYYGAYSIFSRKIHKEVLYLNVFHEILPHSDNPAQTLAEMGLDPSLAPLAGTTLSTPGVPPQVVDIVANRVGYKGILKYYIKNPDRLLEMSEDAGNEAFNLRPSYLGNFERSYALKAAFPTVEPMQALPSVYQSNKFALWSTLKDSALPRSLSLIFVFLLINALAIGVKWIRYDRNPGDRMITKLHMALVVMAGMQFATVILGEGLYEIAKHLFLFNLICEICLVFLIVYAVNIGAILPVRKRQQG